MPREMKDSGVEWIGMIPSSWKVLHVNAAFTRKNSKAEQEDPVILSLARSGVKIRDISNNDGQLAESYYNYNPVKPGDLLLNPMDLVSGANCSISGVTGVISPAYINLRTRDGYDPLYYDYYFKTQYWSMAFFAHGKGVSFDNRWTMSAGDLLHYAIPVPSEEEQHKIATFLRHKCAKIDKVITDTERSIEEYKKLKQSIVTEAVTKGMRGNNREMRDSGIEWIEQIPKEWKISKIKYVSTFNPSCKEVDDDAMVTYTPMENIKNGYFLENSVVKNKVPASLTPYEDGDIVLAKVTPCFENMNISIMDRLSSGIGYGSSELFVFRPTKINTAYLFYWLQNFYFIDMGIATMTGTGGLKRVSPYYVKNSFVLLPPDNEQIEITAYLERNIGVLNRIIVAKEKFIRELEQYKKSIIYEYITGKKEVPEL